jgi:hypothetical protein
MDQASWVKGSRDKIGGGTGNWEDNRNRGAFREREVRNAKSQNKVNGEVLPKRRDHLKPSITHYSGHCIKKVFCPCPQRLEACSVPTYPARLRDSWGVHPPFSSSELLLGVLLQPAMIILTSLEFAGGTSDSRDFPLPFRDLSYLPSPDNNLIDTRYEG